MPRNEQFGRADISIADLAKTVAQVPGSGRSLDGTLSVSLLRALPSREVGIGDAPDMWLAHDLGIALTL